MGRVVVAMAEVKVGERVGLNVGYRPNQVTSNSFRRSHKRTFVRATGGRIRVESRRSAGSRPRPKAVVRLVSLAGLSGLEVNGEK